MSENGHKTLPTSFWLDEDTREILDTLTKEQEAYLASWEEGT